MIPFLGFLSHEQPGRGLPSWLQERLFTPCLQGARLAVWGGTSVADSFAFLSFLPFSDTSFLHLP